MKNRRTIIIFVTLFLSGCLQSTLNLPPDYENLRRIEAGTLENSVRIIAGPPDRIVKSKKGYRTYYYREKITSDCKKDLQTCIPIVIEKGKVAAVGHQWTKAWEKQHHRNTVLRSGKAAQTMAAEQKTTEQKIARLEKRARALPMSRTMDNLSIYRYLLKLDPDNANYKRKVAFYEKRFEREKAKRVATKKQIVATRKWQNARLQKFKGDPPVQMAIKILGNGKFHVWLKNTGKKPFRVEARQFFLACGKNKRYTVYRSKDFGKDVLPGNVIEGRITFAASCAPREIVYVNPGIAKLSRKIPIPESKPGNLPTTKKPSPQKKK